MLSSVNWCTRFLGGTFQYKAKFDSKWTNRLSVGTVYTFSFGRQTLTPFKRHHDVLGSLSELAVGSPIAVNLRRCKGSSRSGMYRTVNHWLSLSECTSLYVHIVGFVDGMCWNLSHRLIFQRSFSSFTQRIQPISQLGTGTSKFCSFRLSADIFNNASWFLAHIRSSCRHLEFCQCLSLKRS